MVNSQSLKGRLLLSAAAGSVLLLFAHGQAMAAEPPSDSGATVGEVVVTAQKREERVIDVPVSVSVVTSTQIEQRNVTDLSSMQSAIPGLRLVDTGTGQQRVSLRGISQYLGLPTVGVYVDELSVNVFGAGGGQDVRLIDLDRVEVLRGPQPTLYGEESMGGTIRYVTRSPDMERFEGHVEGQIGGVDHGSAAGRAEGAVSIPIVPDKLAVRLAGAYQETGGYIDSPVDKNINNTTIKTLRAKVLFTPTERLKLSLLLMGQRSDQPNANYSARDYTTIEALPSPISDHYFISNLVASYDAGPFTFLNSLGTINRTSDSVIDSFRFYNQYIFGFPFLTSALGESYGKFRSLADEARIVSNGSGPLRYTFGGIYTNAKTSGFNDSTSTPPVIVYNLPFEARSRSWSIYGSAGYDLTSQLGVDLGGRYFHDDRDTGPGTAVGSFHSFNPRASIKYKTSDTGLIYADVAKGFRSGGFNTVVDPTTPATYGPETLWTYEVGVKQELLDRRVLAEAAVYYNDYKDIQAAIAQSNGSAAQTNSGAADGFGVDVTLHGRVTDDLTIGAAVGYVDMKYTTTSVDRHKGEPLDMTPKWTWSVSADYLPQLSDTLRLNLHADYGYTDKATLILHAPPVLDQISYTESRAILNAHAGLMFGEKEIYLYATNLTGTSRIVNPLFGGYYEPIYTRPREIGVGVKADF